MRWPLLQPQKPFNRGDLLIAAEVFGVGSSARFLSLRTFRAPLRESRRLGLGMAIHQKMLELQMDEFFLGARDQLVDS